MAEKKSNKRLNRYELGRKTSNDVLEAEKADVDEIETSQMIKENLEKDIDYKKKHLDFLRKAKYQDDDFDVNEVKKIQMQVYASNSSEAYNLTSKSSIALTVISVIFAILMFMVALLVIIFNTMGYSLIKYDREDMTGIVNKGDVVLVSRDIYELEVDDKVVYRTESGTEMIRIVKSVGDDVVLNTPNDDGYVVLSIAEIDTKITGFVNSKMNGFGDFLMFLLKNWYYFVGGLFVLMLGCFIAKLLIDRHYNILLIKKLEIERENMEKRRKYLSETIGNLEKRGNLFDGAGALEDMLDVNKTPDTRREKKMKKLQSQLKERQQKQIEIIKTGEQFNKEDEKKKQEKQVVDFLREEIQQKEQENKAKLSEEEIEKRRKLAEETNKNIGH